MKIHLERIAYAGWSNCLRLSDGATELVITTHVGPRVIRFARTGGPNVFKEYERQLGRTGGTSWRIYGGHRLWMAPEDVRITNIPDNAPVPWAWNGRMLTVRQPADAVSRISKEIRIYRHGHGEWCIHHRLINRGTRPRTLAPWALTVMTTGGEAIFPQEPYRSHTRQKLPARPLVLWPYTEMADARWSWGTRELRLRQDVCGTRPQKVGFLSTQGWMAYRWKGLVFLKRHPCQAGATYPDFGCNVETFTNQDMLELESLGPLVTLQPGRYVDHTEHWSLHRLPRQVTSADLQRLAGKLQKAAALS